jgi:uncharacterized damage-inducible protein DinB
LQSLFRYNWMVRDEWFQWCEQVSEEELLKRRTGGVGGILETLFHVVYVEHSWICDLIGKPELPLKYQDYNTLAKVRELSASVHPEVKGFVNGWSEEMEDRILEVKKEDGTIRPFTFGEVMRHVIAHEIHHMGQLAIWSRELGLPPVSANVIGRGLFPAALN